MFTRSISIPRPNKSVDTRMLLEVLEVLVSGNTFLLAHARVDAPRREVALREQAVQLRRPRDLRDENHDLVEVQGIEQVIELAVLLGLLELDVVLLQPM